MGCALIATSASRVSDVMRCSRVCAASARTRPIAATACAIRSRELATTAGLRVYTFGTAALARSRSASVSVSETKATERGALTWRSASDPTS